MKENSKTKYDVIYCNLNFAYCLKFNIVAT